MSRGRDYLNQAKWNNFDKLLLEASSLNLSEEIEPSVIPQHRRESQVSYESFDQSSSSSVYSSVPALSRNSTLSSTSTRGSSFSFQHSSISRENAIHKPHSVDDPAFLPSKPGSFHNSELLQKRHRHNIEPDCCFVPCKTVHMNFIPTAQQHFTAPIFVMAGKHFASILSLLFNYHELDPFTPKQDYEKTITWEIDDQSSLLTMSQYTYLPNSHSAWQHLANNLGQRLGITSILVASPYDTINALYKLLDHLVHSIDQAHATDTCPWWTRVILIIDQAMYEERKLFLTYEMPKIMARYRLSHPLSVLFIDTLHDNPKHSQRILWQMMKKHMLCGRWTYTPQNDNDDDSDSSSDDMYAFATVIEYENGKRKKPPKIEKLNCYPGDDGTSVPQ